MCAMCLGTVVGRWVCLYVWCPVIRVEVPLSRLFGRDSKPHHHNNFIAGEGGWTDG